MTVYKCRYPFKFIFTALNLVSGKPTDQSSVHDPESSSEKAVDGCIENSHYLCCAITGQEHRPWWGVDLEATFNIVMVRVLNRGDCCGKTSILNDSYNSFTACALLKRHKGERLSNFDVMVASDVIDPTQSSDKQLCAHVEGPVPQGGWMDIECNPPISGR